MWNEQIKSNLWVDSVGGLRPAKKENNSRRVKQSVMSHGREWESGSRKVEIITWDDEQQVCVVVCWCPRYLELRGGGGLNSLQIQDSVRAVYMDKDILTNSLDTNGHNLSSDDFLVF